MTKAFDDLFKQHNIKFWWHTFY